MSLRRACATTFRRSWAVLCLLVAVGLAVGLLVNEDSWNVAYLRPREALWPACAAPPTTSAPREVLQTQIQRLTQRLDAKRQLLESLTSTILRPKVTKLAPVLPPADALPSVQCNRVPRDDEGLLRTLLNRGVLVRAASQGVQPEAFQVRGVDFVPAAEPLRAPLGEREADYPQTHSVCDATRPANTTPTRVPQVSFCAMVHNEARVKLLVEWVQWHRLLGASSFHLFVAGDPSNSPLAAPLRIFIDRGIVQLERLPTAPFSCLGNRTASIDAAFAGVCFERARARAAGAATEAWVALLDIDEFIHTSRCLGSFIRDAEERVRASSADPPGRKLGALAVGWSLVGHRGADIDRDRTVFEATEFAAGTPDPWFRIIVRADAVTGPPLRPHAVASISLRPTLGERLLFQLAPPFGTFFEDGHPVHQDDVLSSAVDHYSPSGALVAHYHTRSLASTLQRALDRTRFPAAHRTLGDLVHMEFAMELRQGFGRRVSPAIEALHVHLLHALGHDPSVAALQQSVARHPAATATDAEWKRAVAASLDYVLLGLPFSNSTLGEALRTLALGDTPDAVSRLREATTAALAQYFDSREQSER